jgi:hypothetical protein
VPHLGSNSTTCHRRISTSQLHLHLPVLVTAGELVGAALNSTGDIEVQDISNVFVGTPRPGGRSVGNVRVMTVDYFVEVFALGLDSARRAFVF